MDAAFIQPGVKKMDDSECIGQCDTCDSALSAWDYKEGICPDCLEPLETIDEESEAI